MKNAINQLRKSRKWSLEELAEKCCTTRSSITKLISGERQLNDEWIRKLTNAFQCTVADIYGLEVTPPSDTIIFDEETFFKISGAADRLLIKYDEDVNNQQYLRIVVSMYKRFVQRGGDVAEIDEIGAFEVAKEVSDKKSA